MDEDLWAAFDNDLGDFDPDYDYLDVPAVAADERPPPIADPLPRSTSDAFYGQYTELRRSSLPSNSNTALAIRVANSLNAISAQGLNLEIFLDAVFWGDDACTSDPVVRYERTVFMRSPTLSSILARWWSPPTQDHASAGKPQLQEFVMDRAGQLLEKEIINVVQQFKPGPDPLSQASLTAVNFREFGIILTIISTLSYARSHDSCLLTMVWSIYLKACGLSARAFDALHLLGLTMSHKWTASAFGHISQAAGVSRNRAIHSRPHFGSHDNLNFPMRVFSQRLHNLSHFINASAATIWVLPKEALLPPDISAKVKEQRREASQAPFSLTELTTHGEATASSRVKAQARYRILRFLLESPMFKDYPHHKHPALTAPPPTDLLPCGPEHITEQHILETVEVDESSYDGTDELCNKIWLKQMGYMDADQERIGRETLLVWAGDQLTVDRIRGLARYRHDDPNSFARMEWIEPVFGWFHALMAFANSIHAQYLGTSAGIGLRKAFETLGRKGLMKAETKGVFWHHLDEALWHVGEANFLSLWAMVGNVKDVAELAHRSPEELVAILDDIVANHASRDAVEKMDSTALPDSEHDDSKRQAALFSADILAYFDLREAMRIGDVGRMEDLLPTMLYRFLGGGNHKYAVEILELLHKLRAEWPDELR
ncbi:hypothetical protein TRAPUB_6526 [Trametes pubescens]|uniref:DUF6589 domain-containing protein n=1 Tax=Trametes pubescens TaxID=154538 RepID=A0A1M2W6R7_TRAPU|nr:hypothetical protein TRAPUB_6526 [Trametes pubescens]